MTETGIREQIGGVRSNKKSKNFKARTPFASWIWMQRCSLSGSGKPNVGIILPRTIKAKVSATDVLASPKEHDTPPHAILCTSNTLDEAAMYVRERGKVCCRRLELAGVNTPDKKRGLVIFWIIFILVAMLVAARAEVDSEARSIEVSYAVSARPRRSRAPHSRPPSHSLQSHPPPISTPPPLTIPSPHLCVSPYPLLATNSFSSMAQCMT